MRIEQITVDLIRQIDKFQGSFNIARFGALRDSGDNQYEVEIKSFGHATAVKNKSPQLRGKQRVTGFHADDAFYLKEMLDWYRCDQLRCAIQLDYGQMNASLFRHFVAQGLVSSGSGFATVWMDSSEEGKRPVGLLIRESPANEREEYLDLFQRCFAGRGETKPAYRAIQWAEDALPDGKRYIADLDGQPVEFASMPIIDGVAICGTAGTLPEFRGQGIQRSLIERRITDAQRLGCSLLLGGADIGSTPHRNFIRCGFRMLPLGMSWADATDFHAHTA